MAHFALIFTTAGVGWMGIWRDMGVGSLKSYFSFLCVAVTRLKTRNFAIPNEGIY